MREIRVEALTYEGFKNYGDYTTLINPDSPRIGTQPIQFYRDMLTLKLGRDTMPSIGVNRVEKRDFIINTSEYHNFTSEGILPLDGDVIIHVGEATPEGKPNISGIRVFYVPQGTFVTLHPGVWHHASYVVNTDYVNVLIILPERTYENDCHVVRFKNEDYIMIKALEYEE